MRLTPSIRRRIVAILIGLFLFAWLVAFAATYTAAARRIGVLYDAQLAHDAGALLVLAEQGSLTGLHGEDPRRIPANPPPLRKLLAFMVWDGERPRLRSYHAPELARPQAEGYADATFNGRAWRGYTLQRAPGGLTIWVGEPAALRERLVDEVTRDLLLPMLLALPLLAVAVWWGVGRGLLPLARVTTEVAARSPSNLQPVSVTAVPVEISGLVERLNQLLARVREALDRERHFTSDAAHELRTPLAGIRTHAQVALRTGDDAQRRGSLEQVIDGVDRTTHLISQLLTLARLDRAALEDEFVAVPLAPLVAEVLADSQPEAAAKQITLQSRTDNHAAVHGHATALGLLLRNLVDNAIRHTPASGTVEVAIHNADDGVILIVTDNGPGIPPAERVRVFDRFYRGAVASAPGCGLGLSIVQRVAELHGARIGLAEPASGRGLNVTVWLPRPASSAMVGRRALAPSSAR